MLEASNNRPREAWAGWIQPQTLIEQVRNAAPYLAARMPAPETGRLIQMGEHPEGFLPVLSSWESLLRPSLNPEEQLQDYFALCLACHHASVATFVPTDVDSKIRGLIWRETRDLDVMRPMLRFALAASRWTEEGISARNVRGVSGHNGEHWSVLAGALGRFLELGEDGAEALAAIEEEIDREQAIFDRVSAEPGAEIDLLLIAMTLAHNRGDLTQGMSFWRKSPRTHPVMEHLSQRGRFAAAVRLYQQTGMSAEGHRHYPLRAVKPLRRSPDTLLPLAPFLDDWGGRVMQLDERHEVMEALVNGCNKLDGQFGYYRALAGMRAASPREFEQSARRMSNSCQKLLRDAGMRKLIDMPRASFESMMRKRARAALSR